VCVGGCCVSCRQGEDVP